MRKLEEVMRGPAPETQGPERKKLIQDVQTALSYLGGKYEGTFERLAEITGHEEIGGELRDAFSQLKGAKNEKTRQQGEGKFLLVQDALRNRVLSKDPQQRLNRPEEIVPWEGEGFSRYRDFLNTLQSTTTRDGLLGQSAKGDAVAMQLLQAREQALLNQGVLERSFGIRGERDLKTGELKRASGVYDMFEERVRRIVSEGGFRINLEGQYGAIKLEKITIGAMKAKGKRGELAQGEGRIGWRVVTVENVPGVKENTVFDSRLRNAPQEVRSALERAGVFVKRGDEFIELYEREAA